MNLNIQKQTERYIEFLATPYAVNRMGAMWCNSQRILLMFSLKSITPLEAEQRLVGQLSQIKKALGGDES